MRANFIFLMGGSVEDEEVEAAQSSEIQEGRLENSARREINDRDPIHEQAETGARGGQNGRRDRRRRNQRSRRCSAPSGSNRYFLKTLAERSRIDPSRRLTGDLKEATDWRRLLTPATDDPKTREGRLLLSRLFDLFPDGSVPPPSAASAVERLAEGALAIDPASPEWQQISAALTRLRAALTTGANPDAVRAAVRDSVTPLLGVVRKGAVRGMAADPGSDALRSAWAAEGRPR